MFRDFLSKPGSCLPNDLVYRSGRRRPPTRAEGEDPERGLPQKKFDSKCPEMRFPGISERIKMPETVAKIYQFQINCGLMGGGISPISYLWVK